MDMKQLLEAMSKFAGEPDQKPGDQARSTDKATSKGKKHPFLHQLVGDSREYREKTSLVSELQQKFNEFKSELSEYGPVGTYGTQGTSGLRANAPQGTAQNPQAQAQQQQKTQQTLQKSLTQLKSAGVNVNPQQATTALSKSDSGQALSTQDKEVIAKMAPQMGNVLSDPQLANQFKDIVQKAQVKNTQQQQQQQQQAQPGQPNVSK